MNPHEPQVAAWRALLALHRPDREAFLQAATAFVAATDLCIDPVSRTVAAPPKVPVAQPSSSAPAIVHDRHRKATVAPPARIPRPVCKPDLPDGIAVPLVGGSALGMAPSPLFMDRAFLTRWQPGRRLLVYRRGHRLLKQIMQRLQPPGFRVEGEPGLCAYKIGTHAAETDISERLDRLTSDGYGRLWRRGSTIVADPACGRWVLEPMHPGCAEPAPGSPVRIGVEETNSCCPPR